MKKKGCDIRLLNHPVAFVFSGGVSLGAVQVGMVRAALERGISPDFMVGTSAGALNAARVAVDYSEESISKLEDTWLRLRAKDIFPGLLRSVFSVLGRGGYLASPSGLSALLEGKLPKTHKSLKIPIHVIGTDLLSGEAVKLSEGDLRRNLLASAAIPGVFPPVKVDRRLLVDGALAAQVPISTAIELGAKTIFVFDSSYPCVVKEMPTGYLGRLLHLLTILMRSQPLLALSQSEGTGAAIVYLPSPCPQTVLPHDFSQARKLIDEGYLTAKAFLDNLGDVPVGITGHPHFHP